MSPLRAREQAFVVDTRQLPLVCITYPEEPTAADCEELVAILNQLCREESRVAHVVDYRGLNPFAMTAAIRQSAARSFFDGIDARRRATVCEARIVTNALTRGIIVAFDWITGAKWSCASFATPEEAYAWCEAQLAAATAPGEATDETDDDRRPSGLRAIAESGYVQIA